jgi:hypothetical protein
MLSILSPRTFQNRFKAAGEGGGIYKILLCPQAAQFQCPHRTFSRPVSHFQGEEMHTLVKLFTT